MFISDATLTDEEQEAFGIQVEDVVGQWSLYDILCILAIVAVNRISPLKDKHERRRYGALFIKEFGGLSTLSEPSTDVSEETATTNQEHDGSLDAAIVTCSGETDDDDEVWKEINEIESIMLGLGDFCTEYRYGAILRGVPDGIRIILRDYAKERDRNHLVLGAIASAVIRRSEKRYNETTKAMRELNTKLKPAAESVGAHQNSRVRDAVILEAIDALLKFSSCSDGA
jgi:hypothetical protein